MLSTAGDSGSAVNPGPARPEHVGRTPSPPAARARCSARRQGCKPLGSRFLLLALLGLTACGGGGGSSGTGGGGGGPPGPVTYLFEAFDGGFPSTGWTLLSGGLGQDAADGSPPGSCAATAFTNCLAAGQAAHSGALPLNNALILDFDVKVATQDMTASGGAQLSLWRGDTGQQFVLVVARRAGMNLSVEAIHFEDGTSTGSSFAGQAFPRDNAYHWVRLTVGTDRWVRLYRDGLFLGGRQMTQPLPPNVMLRLRLDENDCQGESSVRVDNLEAWRP